MSNDELTFEEKMAICKREVRRLQVNGVLLSVNTKYRHAHVRRDIGIKLHSSIDALRNLGDYNVTFSS